MVSLLILLLRVSYNLASRVAELEIGLYISAWSSFMEPMAVMPWPGHVHMAEQQLEQWLCWVASLSYQASDWL